MDEDTANPYFYFKIDGVMDPAFEGEINDEAEENGSNPNVIIILAVMAVIVCGTVGIVFVKKNKEAKK